MLCDLYEVHVVRTTRSTVCNRSNAEGNGSDDSNSIVDNSYRKLALLPTWVISYIWMFSDITDGMFSSLCRKIEPYDTDDSKGTTNTNWQIIQEFGRRPQLSISYSMGSSLASAGYFLRFTRKLLPQCYQKRKNNSNIGYFKHKCSCHMDICGFHWIGAKADRMTQGAYRMDEQFFSAMFVIGHD